MTVPAAAAPPPAYEVSAWRAIPSLVHGFFGRRGGVGNGAFATLNVSDRVGDDPVAVAENWRRVASHCPDLSFVRMQQVHGARVACVEADAPPVGDADGLLAARDGLGLTVLTADCVPVLGVAPRHRAVMALHAGWRGALAGIARVGLAEAQRRLAIEPAAWHIALGPAIGGCCYEVEARIGEDFIARWGAMPDAWQPCGARGQLDLRMAIRQMLLAAGVPAAQIAIGGPCTSCAEAEYFSHRRSGGRAGRQLSVIGWRS